MIKKLKMAGWVILVFWLIAIILTYNNTWYWYAYLIISASAFFLAGILLYHSEVKQLYTNTFSKQHTLKSEPKQTISHHDDEDYDDITVERTRQKRKRKRKKKYALMETGSRERKKTNQQYASNKSLHKASSIRNKEYLHTKIPLLYNGDQQELLFNTIQQLKEQDFFTSYYAGVTNEDLITHFSEYQERNIFELYDNTIPNTFAKVLYDPESVSNRIGIFLGKQPVIEAAEENNLTENMLGFIDIRDSYKAELLLNKYNNIQVFPTILGGTYKRVYKNEEGSIKIIKDFINYDLTISLAFYNN